MVTLLAASFGTLMQGAVSREGAGGDEGSGVGVSSGGAGGSSSEHLAALGNETDVGEVLPSFQPSGVAALLYEGGLFRCHVVCMAF